VKELCLELFNIEGTYYSDKRTNGGVTIFRVSHADSLKPIFCRGANNKRIPEIIKQSNENVIKAYIRGMTLDSTVQRGRIRMTISNKLDAQFIQFFLCSQGILSCVKTSKHQYKNGGELYYVIVSGDYLNKFLDNIGVVQSRKNIRNVDKQEHYKNVLLDKSFRIRVTDIEYSKNDVYDLHVPGTHSYLSNSMISHNTGRFSSSNPNFQNIPSHEKSIRRLFMGAREVFESANNGVIRLFEEDLVQTEVGEKDSQNLVIGDVLVCEDGHFRIKDIKKDGVIIYVLV
jgi:hypothetical protein